MTAKSICEGGPCMHDPNCPDHYCEGRPMASDIQMHWKDGGHTFHRGVVFPIELEEEDPPVITPEGAESAWAVVQDVLAFVAVALLALAASTLRSKGAL